MLSTIKTLRSTRTRLSTPASCPVRRKPLPKIHEEDPDNGNSTASQLAKSRLKGDLYESDKEVVKSEPVKKKYARPLPRLPFCEEYDGINLRKTSTISQSIVELIASQKKGQEEIAPDDAIGDEDDVEYKSTRYFDRLQDFQRMFKVAGRYSSVSDDAPESPDSGLTMGFSSDTVTIASSFDPFDDIRFEQDESDDICTIDLEMEHVRESDRLVLKVIKAEDVTDMKSSNKLIDTFVKVSMYHGKRNKKQRTEVVTKSRDPVFNHTFFLDNVTEKWMHLMCLRVQLYQKTTFRKVCIGESLIWLDDLGFTSEKKVLMTESLKRPFL